MCVCVCVCVCVRQCVCVCVDGRMFSQLVQTSRLFLVYLDIDCLCQCSFVLPRNFNYTEDNIVYSI